MTDDEIQVVAEELAKVGGLSWYPGRPGETFLRPVSEGYLEQAKAVIAAFDRVRAGGSQEASPPEAPSGTLVSPTCPDSDTNNELKVGDVVEYYPPGDKRGITCRIEELKDSRAWLKPLANPEIDWVELSPPLRFSA